jgi:hypothetical protein
VQLAGRLLVDTVVGKAFVGYIYLASSANAGLPVSQARDAVPIGHRRNAAGDGFPGSEDGRRKP